MKDTCMRWLWIKIKRLAEEEVNRHGVRFSVEIGDQPWGRWGAFRCGDSSPFRTIIHHECVLLLHQTKGLG
jgi:hypothetical protein